ncbi:glutathione S-transferase family protein [Sphingomonas sp. GlSt437]|uniref:glutathione S-transferase family protein n=1 Tax=Sphingomonas sp. GlSt437 TaxID=3389970 RepID=UPI003A8ACDA6
MITLYDFPRAPSPRRARVLLAEKGIPHETVIVDLAQQEQLGEAFRAINPRCTVPALRLDDGTVLTDNAGIAAWAEAAYPEPPLLGVTPIEKAEIASWNARIEQEGFYAVAEAMRNSAPAMKGRALTGAVDYEQIPELAERGLARLGHFFEMLDAHLADRAFVATDRFSLADISAVIVTDFARVVRLKAAEEFAHIGKWRAHMAERPSFSL